MCRGDKIESIPTDEVDMLQRRQKIIGKKCGVVLSIPIGCGILKNLQLVGIFPTSRWLTDPTMPPDVKEMFGGTPFFALGEYRVANIDIQDATGQLLPLTIVVNSGVSGMCTGHWGGAYLRSTPHMWVARFETTGEFQTKVVQEGIGSFFAEHSNVEFFDESFEGGLAPGLCSTQFEKLLGVAMEFILYKADWSCLPQKLIEQRDTSPRAARKRARRRICNQKPINLFKAD